MPNLSLLAWGFVVLGILGTLSGIAYQIRESGAESVMLEWAEANRVQREKEQAQSFKAAEKKEKGDAKARIVYRTITLEVERVVKNPVFNHVCLPDDGLSIARSAINGTLPTTPEPDKPLPTPAGTDGRDSGKRP